MVNPFSIHPDIQSDVQSDTHSDTHSNTHPDIQSDANSGKRGAAYVSSSRSATPARSRHRPRSVPISTLNPASPAPSTLRPTPREAASIAPRAPAPDPRTRGAPGLNSSRCVSDNGALEAFPDDLPPPTQTGPCSSIPRRPLSRRRAHEQAPAPDPAFLPLSRTTDRVLTILLEGDLYRLRAEGVAESLGISCTTLRRRLRNDHTNYQFLLDRARQYRCEARLRERWLPGKCMADELGYLEVNSFYRAFRRWTGVSYSAYRVQRDL